MKTVRVILVALFLAGMLYPNVLYAYGMRTGFGKVIMEKIPMGRDYSMRKDAKFPLVIENKSDKEMEVKLEVLIPKVGEIQEGYEAIPDANWIALEKDALVIEPNGKSETDVIIRVPDNKEYLGRRFHVFIWSHTMGEAVGIGIKSKLLFSVGEKSKE